jgi:hypothetical protein
MKSVKVIVQWILVALLAIMVIAWAPSFASVLFLLGAIILLPISKLEEIHEKINLKLGVRIVIAFLLFAVGAGAALNRERQKEAKENVSSSSDTKEKSDDKSDSKKDDKKESKNDSKNDDKKDNQNEDIRSQIAGTWHYGASAAIDMYFTFKEDGSWEYDSENDDSDSGTYEIVDENTIKLKGGSEVDRIFKIKSTDELIDEYDTSLTRYISE